VNDRNGVDSKRCFKCSTTKPMSEFYRHPKMADGVLGKCKACTKADTMMRYYSKHDEVAAYDRARFQTPERKAKAQEYARRCRERHPLKYKARTALGNALRDGVIERPSTCPLCNFAKPIEAHHEDYSRPLDVKWCCRSCHRRVYHGQMCS
jgi:hypothetical protein